MKSIKVIAAALFTVLMLASCGGNTPESVATKFLNAMRALDLETAKKYSTEQMGYQFDEMRSYYSAEEFEAERKIMIEESKRVKIKAVDSKVSDGGDLATVTVEIIENDGEKERHEMYLRKENGTWKVYDLGE